MRGLIAILNDKTLRRKLEADLASEYNIDLRDLWRKGSGLTVRRLVALIYELPDDSRLKKHVAGDKAIFDTKEHLLADLRDVLNAIQYLTGISATRDMKSSQVKKVVRGLPERIHRPGDPEPEKRFATPEELAMRFPPKKTQRILEARRRRKGLSQ